MSVYAGRIREALRGAVDVRALAEAWQALHPGQVSKALRPALAAFLARAREAITSALRAVLGRLWPEAHLLGELAAQAAVDGLESVDWGRWTPGDWEAAQEAAGAGLRQLLAEAGIRIKSIAETRLEELAAVLEATLASDITQREMDQPVPVTNSVQSLTAQLVQVLDNPRNAELVAWTEIARAQSSAALRIYAEDGITHVEWSTAEDARVCPLCDANEAAGPVPAGAAFPSGAVFPPQHPRCRCALLPVLPAVAA